MSSCINFSQEFIGLWLCQPTPSRIWDPAQAPFPQNEQSGFALQTSAQRVPRRQGPSGDPGNFPTHWRTFIQETIALVRRLVHRWDKAACLGTSGFKSSCRLVDRGSSASHLVRGGSPWDHAGLQVSGGTRWRKKHVRFSSILPPSFPRKCRSMGTAWRTFCSKCSQAESLSWTRGLSQFRIRVSGVQKPKRKVEEVFFKYLLRC